MSTDALITLGVLLVFLGIIIRGRLAVLYSFDSGLGATPQSVGVKAADSPELCFYFRWHLHADWH